MDGGRIVQFETPDAVWKRPASRTVAGLLGQAQHIDGSVDADGVTTAFGRLPAASDGTEPGEPVDVLVRPNAVTLERVVERPVSNGRVEDIRFLGDRYLVVVRSAGQTLRASLEDLAGIAVGDLVIARFDPRGTFVYASRDH